MSGTETKRHDEDVAAEPRLVSAHILTTVVNSSVMAAAFSTCASAMVAAVQWVEGEAETRLSGSLAERYEKARRYVEGQNGQMMIVKTKVS